MPARRTNRKRPITIDDITAIKFLRAPALSPDEEQVCFVVETVAKDHKKYNSHLWRCDVDGGNVRQLTFGDRGDSSPVYSPDGKWIAFTSKRGDHPGIHLLPTDGGEAKALVEKDGAFASLVFTPDSKSIICAYRENDPPQESTAKAEDESDKKPKKETPAYRHITRLFYRLDGVGFLPKAPFHIWIFDVETGEGRQLTRGRYDDLSPTVSPDGRLVAFISNRQPDPDRDPWLTDLFTVPTKGGLMKKIPTPPGPIESPSFSPNGKLIAYIGHDQPDTPYGVVPMHPWVVGVNGRPAARDLTPGFDRSAEDDTISDTGEGFGIMAPHWSRNGRSLIINVADTGSTIPFVVPARGGKPKRLFSGKLHIQAMVFGRLNKRAAILYGDDKAPAEIGIVELERRTPRARQITNLNRDWLKDVQVGRPQEVWFTSTNKTRIQGWVLKPPNFRRGRKYPSILEVHGGPRTQYGYTFFHEMQALAAKGYVVFYTNPRGSQGRGQDFTGAIVEGWGTVDYEDVMAAADWLEKQPYIDKKRMGITGGSYGGYMTNWVVGHTKRFRAAVTQRSVVELSTFFGSSDVGWLWKTEFGGQPWEAREAYDRMSPLTYANNIRTPLLIIHSENDLRCAIEQGEQLFARLKYLRRTVELVRFPEEPHGLSRHGRPDRRIRRLEFIANWFDKYMRRR